MDIMREKSTVILQRSSRSSRVENSTPGNYIDESKAIWEEGAARVHKYNSTREGHLGQIKSKDFTI